MATWTTYECPLLEYDSAKEGSTLKVYFEAVLQRAAGPDLAQARLVDVGTGLPVAGSVISTSSVTPVRVRSGSLTLSAASYRAEIGTEVGSTVTCQAARLVVDVG